MLRAHRFAATSATIIAAAVALGCSKAADAPPAPPVVTIGLSEYAFEAPDSIPAGYTTFQAVNKGKELHHATLIRIDSGKTMADVMTALQTQGPPPAWAVALGGPQQSSRVTIDMTPGLYLWLCFIPGPDGLPHVMKGMMKAFTVTAPVAGAVVAAAPAADIDVVASDYKWTFSQPLTAGTHTLKITTAPGQPHEFVLLRLKDGKTAADAAAYTEKMVGESPIETVEGISTLQSGLVNYETIDIKPGHYVIICFVPDMADGKPHVAHGMMQDLVIQ